MLALPLYEKDTDSPSASKRRQTEVSLFVGNVTAEYWLNNKHNGQLCQSDCSQRTKRAVLNSYQVRNDIDYQLVSASTYLF